VVKNGCGLGFGAGSKLTRRRRYLILAVVGLPGWSLPNAGSVSQMRLGPRSERNSCSRSFGDQTRRLGGRGGEVGESITMAFTSSFPIINYQRRLHNLPLVPLVPLVPLFQGSVGRAALSRICAFQTDSPASANWRPASSCIIIRVPETLTTCCGFWAVSCQATSDKKAFSYQSKIFKELLA